MIVVYDIYGFETKEKQVNSSITNPVDVYSEINNGAYSEDIKENKASFVYASIQKKDYDATDDDAPGHIHNPVTNDAESLVEEHYSPICTFLLSLSLMKMGS